LDFTFGEGKAPNRYKEQEIMPFLDGPGKQRLVPCMAFFGANASGKTNILRAFHTLGGLVRGEANLIEHFDPNMLNRKFEDTTFELTFVNGQSSFTYRLVFDSSTIKEEALSKDGEAVFQISQMKPEFSPVLISPTYSLEKLAEVIRVECSDGEGRQVRSFLNRIGVAYSGLSADLKGAFSYISRLNCLDSNQFVVHPVIALNILASSLNGDGKAALQEVVDVVRRLDIDIQGLDILKKEVGKDEPFRSGVFMQINAQAGTRHAFHLISTHKDIDGNLQAFNFAQHESAGTQRLVVLMGLILHSLNVGGLLIIDELECSLHPLLMREIVTLFKKRSRNPKGAQLVFSTHNTDILDDSVLRLSEVSLVRKTLSNGTITRRLVDLRDDGEDIRNVTNFRKQYLDGLYSGVPHPAL
jgi:AAA15 family ATPase/GTPase